MLSRLATGLAASTLLAAATAPTTIAQHAEPDSAAIDRYVRAEMSARHIPGLQVVIARAHRVIFSASYGLADIAAARPVDSATSFEIASITKQFTDAAVMLLAQEKKIALDDRIARYLPGLPPAWQTITIRQLMTHTAGLRDDWDEDDSYFQSHVSDSSFLAALESEPLRFTPGTSFSYGCGPFVLGMLITRVADAPYHEFMRERIFHPLRLSRTGVNEVDVEAHAATGYRLAHDTLVAGVVISGAAHARADVGIHTTALDLARWDAALDGDKLLTSNSRSTMFSPAHVTSGAAVPYGFGWFIRPYRGHSEIEHDGGFRTGFSSTIARYPDDSLTVIVLTNLQAAHAYTIARGVASLYDADYTPIPHMLPSAGRHDARYEIVKRAFAKVAAGRTAVELLPGALRITGAMPEDVRAGLAGGGTISSLGCRRVARVERLFTHRMISAICFYRAPRPAGTYWSVAFTPDNRIAYLEPEE